MIFQFNKCRKLMSTDNFDTVCCCKLSKLLMQPDDYIRRVLHALRGNCTSNQNLACFVPRLKIINTTLKMIYEFKSKLPTTFKSDIEILEGQGVLKQSNVLHVLINNSRTAAPAEIPMPFLSFSKNLFKDIIISFFKKVLAILRQCMKYVQFWFGVLFPLDKTKQCIRCALCTLMV